MDYLRNVAGVLVFRGGSLRRLAARRALVEAWLVLVVGFVTFALVRVSVYPRVPEYAGFGHGVVAALLDLDLLPALAFLALLYIPGLICLSNAIAGDGLGFSCSTEEYRRHVAALFPIWGAVLLAAAAAQALFPGFIGVGPVEVSIGLVVLGGLATVYSVWTIKELDYVSEFAALGVFVLSWATLPLFYVLARFVLALPLLLLVPLVYVVGPRLRDLFGSSGRERALAAHLKVLTANPRDADAHYQLGLLHLGRGNFGAAEEYFAAAVEIDPSDADHPYHLGRVCEERGQWDKAREHYEATYRLSPEYALLDIVRDVGKSYVNTGGVEQGIEFLRYFLDRRPSDPEARFWLAVALERVGRHDAMKVELAVLLEQARSNPRFFRKSHRKWLYRARQLSRGGAAPDGAGAGAPLP